MSAHTEKSPASRRIAKPQAKAKPPPIAIKTLKSSRAAELSTWQAATGAHGNGAGKHKANEPQSPAKIYDRQELRTAIQSKIRIALTVTMPIAGKPTLEPSIMGARHRPGLLASPNPIPFPKPLTDAASQRLFAWT